MTMYISSFYRKIQNEFHQKEKPSRLVQSYEYFDKLKKPRADNQPSKRAQFSRPQHSSRQPVNHLHSSPYDRLEASSPAENLRTSQNYSNNNNNSNLMSVSIDRKNQSNILRRSMERPNRLSANPANPRRISTGDTHRSRSQLRSDSETRKMSYSSSQTRKNSRKNSSVENQNGKLTSKRLQTIKSNKSTEGSKTKDSEENNAEMEELYVTEGLDDAFYRRIRSWVSEVDKCLRSGDFDRKVVMDSSEMDYPEDPPYSRETSDGLNFRPGNHHTVTVVIADDGS